MATTKNQKKREQFAILCEQIAGGKNRSSDELRNQNRRVEQKKRAQFKRAR